MFAQDPVKENRFTLIFDDEVDGPLLEACRRPPEEPVSKAWV